MYVRGKLQSRKVLTASLLVRPIHTVPVPVTDIVGVYAAVVWTLKLSWMARASQICQHKLLDNNMIILSVQVLV